jgi:hypothetical protein
MRKNSGSRATIFMRLGLAGDAWDRQVTKVATKITCR